MALDITELYNVTSGAVREAAKAAPTTRIEDYSENGFDAMLSVGCGKRRNQVGAGRDGKFP